MRPWPFRSLRRNQELDEELRAHLAFAARDLEERGLGADEAARRARREFGNVGVIREATRDVWGGSGLEAFVQDARYGLRGLRLNPGFTVAVLVSLAIGIGANTAIFSLIDVTLNRPLPFPDPDRLVTLAEENPSKGRVAGGAAPGNMLDWRAAGSVFSGLTGFYSRSVVISEEADAEVVIGAQVTADFFRVFGVAPGLGRTFSPEESEAGMTGIIENSVPGPVVLSDRLWERRFGGAPDALGRTISLDGTPREVVGVMPASFVASGPGTELWLPWDLERDYARLKVVPRDFRFLDVVGRLRPGVTLDAARSEMAALSTAIAERHPDTNAGWGVALKPFRESVVGSTRAPLIALFVAVVLVLLLTCANVANLQVARGAVREREMAIRLAVGVGRGRLIRQLFTESLIICALGGLLGVALAALLLKYLLVLAPPSIVALDQIAVDGRVLVFAAVVTLLVAMVSGLLPALRTSRVSLASVLRAGTQAGSAGLRLGVRRHLVVAQVAIALVLVAGALLITQSVSALRRVDPGFSVDNRLMIRVSLNTRKYRTGPLRIAYFEELVNKLRALPGAKAVGGTTVLPMSEGGTDFSRPYWREDRPRPVGAPAPVDVRMILPGYVEAMGMRMKAGRNFDDRDAPGSPMAVIINESLARTTWPGEDPVGKRIVLDYIKGPYPYEVVGIVNDTRYYGLRSQARPEVFINYRQNPYPALFLVVLSKADPAGLAAGARAALKDLDPTQPAERIVTLPALVESTIARERLASWLFGAMAVISLLLSALGIWGVIEFSVRQTTREIGLRMALGARPEMVFRSVLFEAVRLVVAGLCVGAVVLWPVSMALGSLLFGVSPHDPATLVGSAGLLLTVALVAAAGPSKLALRTDPATALRAN